MNHNYNTDIPSTFAPVIIPTLCRYTHFKECIESLMKCTWAEETDVYIGLDYPAKEEHWDGYLKIKNYLDSLKESHKFKSLTVIKREYNLGLGKDGNFSNLVNYILDKYDYFIASEDDNIFSPAFLDYINKGLIKFKHNKSILAINGYRHFYRIKYGKNTYYRQNIDFSAWGYGIWKDRMILLNSLNRSKYWRLKALNPIIWKKIHENGWNRVLNFIRLIKTVDGLTDNAISVYMAITKKDVIMPRISLVRNMGWDGSGEHCMPENNLTVSHSNQHIENDKIFNYIGTGVEYYRENRSIYLSQSYKKLTFIKFITNILSHSKLYRILKPLLSTK